MSDPKEQLRAMIEALPRYYASNYIGEGLVEDPSGDVLDRDAVLAALAAAPAPTFNDEMHAAFYEYTGTDGSELPHYDGEQWTDFSAGFVAALCRWGAAITDERERFEKWALTCEGNCDRRDLTKSADGRTYVNVVVERDWDVWQARAALAAVPAAAPIVQPVGAELYYEILKPVLSREGMRRFLNGDSITLDPSDYRTIIDRARAALAAPSVQAEPVAWMVGNDVFKTLSEAQANVRNPTLKPAPLYAAPPASTTDDKDAATWRGILEAVIREMPKRGHDARRGNAPGHGHDKPGIWDSDNGVLAGTECAWCKTWNAATAAIASSAAPATPERGCRNCARNETGEGSAECAKCCASSTASEWIATSADEGSSKSSGVKS